MFSLKHKQPATSRCWTTSFITKRKASNARDKYGTVNDRGKTVLSGKHLCTHFFENHDKRAYTRGRPDARNFPFLHFLTHWCTKRKLASHSHEFIPVHLAVCYLQFCTKTRKRCANTPSNEQPLSLSVDNNINCIASKKNCCYIFHAIQSLARLRSQSSCSNKNGWKFILFFGLAFRCWLRTFRRLLTSCAITRVSPVFSFALKTRACAKRRLQIGRTKNLYVSSHQQRARTQWAGLDSFA